MDSVMSMEMRFDENKGGVNNSVDSINSFGSPQAKGKIGARTSISSQGGQPKVGKSKKDFYK